MSKGNTAKRIMWIIGIITFLIVEVIGLCTGKVIEGSLFAEIAKWVLMGLGIAVVVAGLSYSLVGIFFSRKADGLNKKK